MKLADSKLDTIKHIESVRKWIKVVTDKLTQRGIDHDASKLDSPEAECFAEVNEKLAKLTFGSDEYKESLNELQPALKHHYAKNRHHPEHFENGINDMTLIDLVEWLCDCKASTERQHDGNLLISLEKAAERFNIDDQLKQILLNTAKTFDEHQN